MQKDFKIKEILHIKNFIRTTMVQLTKNPETKVLIEEKADDRIFKDFHVLSIIEDFFVQGVEPDKELDADQQEGFAFNTDF